MTDNRRDTELTVRVKDLGSKTFREVASSVKSVTEALDLQVVAAERGEVSAKTLRDSVEKLKSANRDLIKQQGLLDFYEVLATRLGAAETKAKEARTEFDNFNASLKGSSASKEQADKLNRLETAATKAEGGIVRASQRLDEQRDKLRAVGVDTENLAAAQQNLVTVNTLVDRSLKQATSAYENYDTKLAATRAAEDALATAQQAKDSSARASTVKQDLTFQQALAGALNQTATAERDLAAAEDRRAASDRAKNVRADLAFQGELEAALERTAAAERNLAAAAELSGFQKVGTDAIAAASKIDVYSIAAGKAAPASSRIAASLNAILHPSQEVVKTLAGLEGEINRVTAVIGDGKGSVHSYAEAFQDLDRVQRQVIKSAGDLDVYKDQARAVAHAQAAFDSAKADVLAYANAVRTADQPNVELAASLKTAQGAMNAAEKELAQQITKLKSYGTALKTAGVDVTDLAAAEKRLAGVANSTAAATDKLNKAASGQNGKVGRFLGLKPYELQNLAFQLNDVFTQIASGTSITQTFAQQGGQIVQLFPRMFAALIPLAPVILAVGLAVGLVVSSMRQLFDLEDSQRKFAGTLALTADGANVSAAALAETAHELDVFGTSLKDTRAELTIFLKEGLDPKRFKDMGVAAQNLADVTGKKVPEAAKQLAEGFTGGFKAIQALNDEYDFLTANELESIRQQFELGNATGALETAFDKLTTKLEKAAAVSRNDLDVSVKNLTASWDGLLHNLGNFLPIQGATDFINGLANAVRTLTEIIPRAKKVQDDALNNKGSGTPAKPKMRENQATLGNMGRVAGFAIGAAQQLAPGVFDGLDPLVKKLTEVRETGVKAGEDTSAALGKVGNKASLAANAIRRELVIALDKAKEKAGALSDAKRLELAGIVAVTKGTEAGITDKKTLEEFRALGKEAEQQEINKEHARKAAAADRKAAAADRKAESEENKRLAIQATLLGQLRQVSIKASKAGTADLEDQLAAVDDEYAKIFETVDKLKKAGGKSIKGKSFVDFTAEVEAGKELIKQQVTLKKYADDIKALEDQRGERLNAIKDSVAAGNKTAVQGLADAQAVVDDLDPKIASIAGGALLFATAIGGATPPPEILAFIDKMQRLIDAGGANAKRTNSPVAKLGQDLLGAQQADLDKLVQARDKVVQNEKRLVDLGLHTQVDAQDNIRAAYAATTGQITAQANAVLALATKMRDAGAISAVAFQGLKTDLDLVIQGTQYVDENFTKIHDTIVGSIQTGISAAFDTISEAIGRAIQGTGSWEDALRSIGAAALNFVASFLKGIADVLLQIAVLQAIKNIPFLNGLTTGIMDFAGLTTGAAALSVPAAALNTGAVALGASAVALDLPSAALVAGATGLATVSIPLGVSAGILATAAEALGVSAGVLQAAATTLLIANSIKPVPVLHSGGTVGPGGSNRSRSVSASLFAGAPRYHSGTVVGLKTDEQAAIVQNGEEILSKDSPRNILNGGAAAGGGQPAKGGGISRLTINNLLDSGEVVSAGLNSRKGEQTFMNFLRTNRTQIKSIIG